MDFSKIKHKLFTRANKSFTPVINDSRKASYFTITLSLFCLSFASMRSCFAASNSFLINFFPSEKGSILFFSSAVLNSRFMRFPKHNTFFYLIGKDFVCFFDFHPLLGCVQDRLYFEGGTIFDDALLNFFFISAQNE